MENELAVLAIKVGRYSEAEAMFNDELKTTPTYNSYFGLGSCKINLLLDANRSVDEVIYCFEKSLSIVDKKDKIELEKQVLDITISTLKQFKELYQKLEKEKKKQATAALTGLALTIGAAAVGSSNNSNAFTQIASLAVAGAGVGVSLEGLSNIGEIPEIMDYIIKTSKEIINKSKSILKNHSEDFSSELNKLDVDNWEIKKSAQWDKIGSTIGLPSSKNQKTQLIMDWLFFMHRFKHKDNGLKHLLTFGGFGIWHLHDLYLILTDKFLD
jgi:hypothetical protein